MLIAVARLAICGDSCWSTLASSL